MIEADLAQWPDDVKAIMMLAFIHAALGRKEDALREGRRAIGLLPISKDAYDGPILATNLAAIYAQVGERDLALEQLATLVEVPNGPTLGTLRARAGVGLTARRPALRENGRFARSEETVKFHRLLLRKKSHARSNLGRVTFLPQTHDD